LAGIDEIPPMPEVVFKAQELLADPESSAQKLAAILETDQAIATKVLKMANSVFYGMSGKGYEDNDFLYELEEGTMDYLDFDQNDISDLTLELMESVDKLLDSQNVN
jgi:hypothetical protein